MSLRGYLVQLVVAVERVGCRDLQEQGDCQKIVVADNKRESSAALVACRFRSKLTIAAVPDDILNELHRFPFPIQKLMAGEALAVANRVAKGKQAPDLTKPKCHLFHEQIYGIFKPLTTNVWMDFQRTFEGKGLRCTSVVNLSRYQQV
ncbi:hypothetical protein BC938DRAFT_482614 [Jimgerdemannia flammicorona]|uniref:Uncharacterized protein n=1 Tax=Jimgerdemannia flammicorona TaxID=994334 RepID=A0A433QDJ9_9FUNG|nr:hypothetical protein BC938DRAFT_482614 [Jimgerdemannia flammicorona]